MKLFIGLDVSFAKTAACMLDEHGRIVREAEIASDPEALAKFATEQPGEIAVIGLEAGPLSQWLHRGLADAGFDAVLMETRQVKGALKAMPISEAEHRSVRGTDLPPNRPAGRRGHRPAARIWAGSGRSIASPSRRRKSGRCSRRARRSRRA